MNVTVSASTPIGRLATLGTSAWLDSIRRSMLTGGELARLVREDGVVGVTSNPSIFEQAILGSPDYDERLAELTHEGADVESIYWTLAIEDVQGAADVLRPVYDATNGIDGYVSLEVAPDVARDTDATLAMARDLWARVDRPNAMIKIPGTPEGVPAIRAAIADGININVTLLFALDAWAAIAEAWLTGLEDRAARGEPVDGVASVASFFVSRVDTSADKRLKALGHEEQSGRAAVANAQLAYARWLTLVSGERFAALRAKGATPQRLLWASTGTKDPNYSDVKYVAELAGPKTVNTMPLATLLAYQDHGAVAEPLLEDAEPAARAAIAAVEAAGVSLQEVTDELLEAGIVQFADAMDRLLAGVERRRAAVIAGEPAGIEARLADAQASAIGARAAWAQEQQLLRRVWSKDDALWPAGDDKPSERLGWLTIAERSLAQMEELDVFVAELRAEGFTDCALLGMGGSSLAPEVLWQTFGAREGFLRLHVLDSTHPDAVAALERKLPLATTLFLVSSKSGGTLEPRSMHAHFHALAPDGRQWAAVTDPGTALEALAQEQGFRRVFHGAPDIGGRYSALSAFGVVPAALIGADVRGLLARAEVAARAADPSLAPGDAPALWLGLALGELARMGRDKLTFVVEEPLSSLGLWLEQLVAESTGKQGKGIVPIADEPLGEVAEYGEDRVFVHVHDTSGEGDAELARRLDALADAGHPVIAFPFEEAADVGAQFFHWELAVAVAGAVLELNPFDQPNVQEAKDLTVATIEAYERDGSFPAADSGAVEGEAAAGALREMVDAAADGAYVATMAFLAPDPRVDAALTALRLAIRRRAHAATTVGYGPRFLHSTGQLHKGGPATGAFLQLVDDGSAGVAIPGAAYDFAALVRAQAIGDGRALRSRGRPFLRIQLGGDPAGEIAALAAALDQGAQLMQIGFVGLGRMGGNMVTRLRQGGHDVVAFDFSAAAVAKAQEQGATGVDSLEALVAALEAPRRIWIMVPSGDPVQQTLDALATLVDPGDLLIDGGNSNFHDTQRRGAELAERGVRFCDVGVSGGVWGLQVGYCMMSGGEAQDMDALKPALDTLAPPDGWLHVGPIGAGHYVKMVHNGIEYGMLQAYGEGFEILKNGQFELDLGAISHLWNQGSVVRSWLLELAERAFANGSELEGIRGYVDDSGEGRWTVQEAIDTSTPAPVLTLSLLARFASRQDESYSAKVIAALRNEFGGHAIHKE